MKKTLHKPQAGDVDINGNVYANEACKSTPNRICTDICTDNVCDGSAEWPVFLNDTCTNTCVNDHC